MNIFVGHLAPAVTNDDLHATFGSYGNVINAVVAKDKATRKPLGYGHVYLLPVEAAERAIKDLNRMVLRGRPIVVRASAERAKSDRRHQQVHFEGQDRRRKTERRINGAWAPESGGNGSAASHR